MRSIPDQCGIYYYGWNYASLADVEGTGEEADPGSDLNDKLSKL